MTFWSMPKKHFNHRNQIPLKHLTDSVRCYVSTNKITIRLILNKIYKYIKLKKRKKKEEG
jgi:hypothetical protein